MTVRTNISPHSLKSQVTAKWDCLGIVPLRDFNSLTSGRPGPNTPSSVSVFPESRNLRIRFVVHVSSMHSEPGEVLTDLDNTGVPEANQRALFLQPGEMAAKYRPFLKAVATAEFPQHLRTRVDDSDLVQESLLKASRQLESFRGKTEAEFEAWLREILLNQITDCIRHNSRQQRDINVEQQLQSLDHADAGPTASEELRNTESRDLVWQAVSELPEDYRTVILLRQQMDLSFVDIAENMQRTPDAIRMLWGRAIVALGAKLKRTD